MSTLRWFKGPVLIVAIICLVLWVQTASNVVDYSRSMRQIKVDVTQFCAVDRDSYSIDVTIKNNSTHPIHVEAYNFQIHYDTRLMASAVVIEPFTMPAQEDNVRTIILTSTLDADKRPVLEGCGFPDKWEISGRVEVTLPMSRQRATLLTSAGGDS